MNENNPKANLDIEKLVDAFAMALSENDRGEWTDRDKTAKQAILDAFGRVERRAKELESQREIGVSLLLDGEYQRIKLENRDLKKERDALKAAIRNQDHEQPDGCEFCAWSTDQKHAD